MTEQEHIEATLKEVEARIATTQQRVTYHQDRYETFEAGRERQKLGLDMQLATALRGRLRQLQPVNQGSVCRGAIFQGSNF
jgi:hypothetical protein